ncbi:MAG TPA: T9SS type A sorting domain-containing protein [Bacteroidota bacterium]|nr:T9SS type A sorting domain-containing protein [Bacteroidota bacterium]
MKRFTPVLSVIAAVCAFIFILNSSQGKKNPREDEELLESVVGVGDNPDAAYQFRYAILAGKERDIDLRGFRKDAVVYSKQHSVPAKNLMKVTTPFWSALGPGNIGGRVRSIVIDPLNSSIILAGSVSGGIWKTTDGGASWSPKTDGQDNLAISSMVVDPTNDSVVYAGTGEGWSNVDAVYGGGIFKSTDFGETWTLLSSTSSSASFGDVMKLAADSSGNIYAATKNYRYGYGPTTYTANGGLYKTTNGGTSWTEISSATFSTNYFNPTDVLPISSSIILYAVNANGSTLGGIYRTTNGGTNWSLVASNLPTSNYGRIALAQNPDTANIVFAVFESLDESSSGDGGLKGIYKSTDAGATWNQLGTPPKINSTSGRSYLSTQGWYDNVIAVDPNNTSNIYVAGVDMMKSTNGGATWSQLTFWNSYYGTPVVHADHHAIVFDKSHSGTIYDGDDGGIYKTTNSGGAWTDINNGLEITQFYGGATYRSGSTYYGGAQDNGHMKYGGSGTSWTEVYGGDGGYAAQDQTNSSVAYEEYVYLSISKTTDGGGTWNSCVSGLSDANSSSKCLFIAPFALDGQNSAVLIAGSNCVWVTSNSAGSWTQSSNVLSSGYEVSAVTIAGSSANYLGFAGTTDGRVFKCTSLDPSSGIDTWTEITPSGNNGGFVRRIVVDTNNTNQLYVTYGGYNTSGTLASRHVWSSTNQGSTWTDISGNLPNVPVHSLVINPVSSTTLYVGTETGVYSTTNGGSTWSSFNSGMASYVPTDELVLQKSTNTLFAFTHGRSAWIGSGGELPVELSAFNVSPQQSSAVLKWRTETEFNNYGFDVERSSVSTLQSQTASPSPGQWTRLGFVQGAGTSSAPIEYSFTDANVPAGKYSYRLKQINRDGTFQYSEAVDATIASAPSTFALYQNYPNPFNPSTTIRYSIPGKSKVRIDITNAIGQQIAVLDNDEEDPGDHQVEWRANVASGIYFYRINAESVDDPGNRFVEVKKMLLVK